MFKKFFRKPKNLKSLIYILGIFTVIISVFLNYNVSNEIENLINYINIDEKYDAKMQVHFLDVGKADCAYIKCENKNMLIDAGDKEPRNIVLEYLKRQNVDKIDLIIVSHPHRDHIGQMSSIINEFKINRFIMQDTDDKEVQNSSTYKTMLHDLNKNKIKIEHVKAGQNFLLGNMHINILGPLYKYEEVNNNSIVLKIIYGKKSFLFTGDAQDVEEEDFLNCRADLKSDVLKVGHHGSKTSTTRKFLAAVLPEYAVISVGPDRSNLPKEKILKRLKKFGCKILRTDLNGNIIFLTNGDDLKVIQDR